MTLDDLLAGLPDVDLKLLNLGQHNGASAWGAMLSPKVGRDIFAGDGPTPVAAVLMALRGAGIQIEES